MLRALVERLPVMVTPRWVGTRTQPIAIEDVLAYLLAALDFEPDDGEVFEIGGADVCSYLDLMHAYADRRGLRRHMVPVPVLTPRLSSLWLHVVTPVHAGIGRELVDSLRTETVVRDPRALEVFPVRPRTSAEAVARALANEDNEIAEARWTDPALAQSRGYGGFRHGSRLVDSRSVAVACPPAAAFAPIQRIGGDTGWYVGEQLWQVRGAADVLVGGPGLRRGRRDPVDVQIGDAIDFWRVEGFEQDRLLRLAAEMKMPGRAWLQFEVEPDGTSGSTIRQTTVFDPVGVAGLAYWYSLWPIHDHLFGAMLQQIAAASAATSPPTQRSRIGRTTLAGPSVVIGAAPPRGMFRPMGDPRALMERLTAAQNAHDLEGMLACFHEDYLSEQPLFPARTFHGIAQVRANWSALLEGIPDFHAEILRSAVEGDTVFARFTGREPRRTARRLRSVESSSWAPATTASRGGVSTPTKSNARAPTSTPLSAGWRVPKTASARRCHPPTVGGYGSSRSPGRAIRPRSDPQPRRLTPTGVVVVEAQGDLLLVVGLLAEGELRDAQHGAPRTEDRSSGTQMHRGAKKRGPGGRQPSIPSHVHPT